MPNAAPITVREAAAAPITARHRSFRRHNPFIPAAPPLPMNGGHGRVNRSVDYPEKRASWRVHRCARAFG